IINKNKNLKVRLIIGGSGPLLRKMKNYINKKSLGDYIKMEGLIAEKDKANFLASADVAVFPSIGGESFGIVLVEAIASGSRVVIGGNNPGYNYVLGGVTDTLVNPTDPNEMAMKIIRLLDDETLANNL